MQVQLLEWNFRH